MAIKNTCFSEQREAFSIAAQSGSLTIPTENEQSSEGFGARGQTPQRIQKECEEWLFSLGELSRGSCSTFPVWKGM